MNRFQLISEYSYLNTAWTSQHLVPRTYLTSLKNLVNNGMFFRSRKTTAFTFPRSILKPWYLSLLIELSNSWIPWAYTWLLVSDDLFICQKTIQLIIHNSLKHLPYLLEKAPRHLFNFSHHKCGAYSRTAPIRVNTVSCYWNNRGRSIIVHVSSFALFK